MLGIELKREKMDGIDLAVFPADELAITGALIKADFLQPGEQGALVYLNVEGIMDEVMQRAQDRGASIRFAKTHLEECGYIAHISDSEGNKIGLYSMAE
ncbi:hypothetical protein MNBD_GAMMA10-2738 [hydrothermal vent metagenome]|uniref:VOC domain-containing protein n=1 Tax=hydrothermal vent metagenome TaxID=652676 RepID=A0A3B0YE89_9ZZZZ